MNIALLPLLLLASADAAGFVSLPRHGCPGSTSRLRYNQDYTGDAPPFSEAESPQDRARRMEMARELQKAFYKEPGPEPSSSPFVRRPDAQPGTPDDPVCGSTVLHDLPTITTNDGIKGANESSILPGYQFVWDVHDPQHCHMFHSILARPSPWNFAHLHVPGSKPSGDDVRPDNFQSYHDIQTELEYGSPLYGTLMRITDHKFQDEDGKIVLAVQAIDRIRVCDARMAAYLHTDAQFSPEEELMSSHFDEALMSSTSCLYDHCDERSEALSSPSNVNGAARAAAAADALRVRTFEYLPVFLEEKPRGTASSWKPSPKDSSATRKVKDAVRRQVEAKEANGPEYADVAKLAHYDPFAYSSLGDARSTASSALRNYWEHLAGAVSQRASTEEDWLVSAEEDWPVGGGSNKSPSPFFLPEPSRPSPRPRTSTEVAEKMEYEVWRMLDEMIRLLSMAAKATVPLPSQLVGLLPARDNWPRQFALEEYALKLSISGSVAGASFGSPFARIDQIRSRDSSLYSPIRRARRLSYAVWLLLDGLAVTGARPGPPTRHEILGMESVEERLGAARRTLEGINDVLRRLVPENRQDSEK